MARPIITLLTDFGERDTYVGQVKGVILARLPDVQLVDLTHRIPPQDARVGAIHLAAAAPHFPAGTVHLAVVDPGVGTARAPLAATAGGQFFVGPDNGLLAPALARLGGDVRVHRITNEFCRRRSVHPTFHGRDLFAPAAAELARGMPLNEVGPAVDSFVPLVLPEPVVQGAAVRGEVLYVDHFGNGVTNITAEMLPAGPVSLQVTVGNENEKEKGPETRGVPFVSTYADARLEVGAPLALIDSDGRLEIAVRNGSAAEQLGLVPGTPVNVAGAP